MIIKRTALFMKATALTLALVFFLTSMLIANLNSSAVKVSAAEPPKFQASEAFIANAENNPSGPWEWERFRYTDNKFSTLVGMFNTVNSFSQDGFTPGPAFAWMNPNDTTIGIGKYWMRTENSSKGLESARVNNPIRKFTAPGSGKVKIFTADINGDSKIWSPTDGGTTAFCGVRLRITKNGTKIWPESGDWLIIQKMGEKIDFTPIDETLTQGDVLRFELSASAVDNNPSVDGGKFTAAGRQRAYWDPIIQYLDYSSDESAKPTQTPTPTPAPTLASTPTPTPMPLPEVDGIKININGELKTFDQMPVLENGRTLVPMRGIFEALGAKVEWVEATSTVTGILGETSVKLTINSTTAYVNGQQKTLDVPAKLISARTMVPVRFIAESLGATVNWVEDTQTVMITASGSGAGAESVFGTAIQTRAAKEGRRPVPISAVKGKTYADLVFDERTFVEQDVKTDSRTPAEKFKALPEGKVVYNQSKLKAASISGKDYGKLSSVAVEGMSFTEAWRAEVLAVPENPWGYQLILPNLTEGTDFKDGDIMLLVFNMRTEDTIKEDGVGWIQCIVEQQVAPNSKALQENVNAIAGQGWHTVYLPFEAKSGYTRVCIRLGYAIQTVEFGGYELINYEDKVKMEDMPSSSVMEEPYDGRTVFVKDEQWRKEAWDRIEKMRKGDVNVIVKDAAGNPVDGAKVDINMYEHEFQWGTAVNANLTGTESNHAKYRSAVKTLFNSVVAESEHKWTIYENTPEYGRALFDAAKDLGIKYLRGHTMMWDRSFNNGWMQNSSIPHDVFALFQADNKVALDERIKGFIHKIAKEYQGELVDWDVLNEPLNNKAIREKYGNEVLKDWFAWAREGAGPGVKLYINETAISGRNQSRLNSFKQILDYMVQNNVDFDGIGVQGHMGSSKVHPMGLYNELMQLAAYGKEMKITEFDVGVDPNIDPEFEAGFTRDLMIAAFSVENINGFTMWGFWSGSHWLKNASIFSADWSLKKSGGQYIDLVYNKWWTEESGTTGVDGKYSIRGYYGDYDITVTANGQTKTVEAKCYKGQDNTVIITLD